MTDESSGSPTQTSTPYGQMGVTGMRPGVTPIGMVPQRYASIAATLGLAPKQRLRRTAQQITELPPGNAIWQRTTHRRTEKPCD